MAVGSLAFSIAAFVRTGRWRSQERQEAKPAFEVSAKPWYTLGPEGNIVVARVEVVAQNTSNTDTTITELAIEPVGVEGPVRIFGGDYHALPKKIGAHSPFYFTIPGIAFGELLDVLPIASDERQFKVSVRSGHGSTGKYWFSPPFSVDAAPPNEGGYSEWTE